MAQLGGVVHAVHVLAVAFRTERSLHSGVWRRFRRSKQPFHSIRRVCQPLPQADDLAQGGVHEVREGEEAEGVAGRRRVEDNPVEVSKLVRARQVDHLCDRDGIEPAGLTDPHNSSRALRCG